MRPEAAPTNLQPARGEEAREVGFWAGLAVLACGALGVWLGVHALRSFMAMVVWNVAEDLPPNEIGLIALGIYAAGLAAWVPTRLFGGQRPAWRFGLLLALLTVLRQALPGEVLTPVLSMAAWIVWLWWLPAFLRELAERGGGHLVAPAVLLGLAVQIAGQTATQGLDLPMLTGVWWATLGSAVAAAVFVGALFGLGGSARSGGASTESASIGMTWGALALGPYLFLQLTLLANLGRVQTLADWHLLPSALLVQLSLLAGIGALAWNPSRPVRLGLGVLAVVLLVPGEQITGLAIWTLVPVQMALALCLAAAFAPAGFPAHPRVYTATMAGALLLFALLFLFYSRYGWPLVWPVAAGMVAAFALWSGRARVYREPPAVLAAALAALLGASVSLIPYSQAAPAAAPAPAELSIFNYNIHQGFDYWSVPGVHELAEVIEQADADVVALQEVARGWNVNGGVDLAAWLRWRFPQYHLVYGRMNGPLWGNVILSRYPVDDWGWVQYPLRVSDFRRGHVWAVIPTEAGDLLVASTHMSAYESFDEDRLGQVGDMLEFWQGRPGALLVGDFNARPDEEPIQRLLAAGLKDVAADQALSDAYTYSSGNPHERIDYIFTSPDVESLHAEVPHTLASDHLPVAATVRLHAD